MAGYDRSASLDSRQAEFFNAVMQSLDKREAAMFFLEGPAGTGKSHLLNVIYEKACDQGKRVATTASSTVGSTLIQAGVTAHSLFVLPWNPNNENIQVEDKSGIQPGSQRAEWLEKVDLFIWDEVSMSTKQVLEWADNEMRAITGVQEPFGGKMVVFAGDRRGLPPPKYNIYYDKCPAFDWESWPKVRMYSLIENHRYDAIQTKWKELLLEIGSGGCMMDSSLKADLGRPKEYANLNRDMIKENLDDLITETFAECFAEKDRKPTYGRAILTLDNNEAIALNDKILNHLYEEKNVFSIEGKTVKKTFPPLDVQPIDDYDEDFYERYAERLSILGISYDKDAIINKLPFGYPPHTLKLAVGCEVVLLKSIDTGILKDTGVNGAFRNGTILTVENISQKSLTCRIRDDFYDVKTTCSIKKERFDTDSDIIRYQFPVRLSYAMTIHKAQGRTLDKVGLFLDRDVWTHGQLYTALSRVRRREDVKIFLGQYVSKKNIDDQIIAIRNVVDPKILYKANTAEQLKLGVGKEEEDEEEDEEGEDEEEDEKMQ